MMKRFSFLSFFLVFVALVFFASPLYATITNDGDAAVQVQITKQGNIKTTIMLYPNQVIPLPLEAQKIEIVPITFKRDDEDVLVTLLEEEGAKVEITEYNKPHRIGVEEKKVKEKEKGSVKNLGQVNVNLLITRKSGVKYLRSLLQQQEIVLSEDTIEVKVVVNRRMRADEAIEVKTIMPDGKNKTIRTPGGKAVVKQKKEEEENQEQGVLFQSASQEEEDESDAESDTPAEKKRAILV